MLAVVDFECNRVVRIFRECPTVELFVQCNLYALLLRWMAIVKLVAIRLGTWSRKLSGEESQGTENR